MSEMSHRGTHPRRVGERLGNLQLVRLVGEGGMGAVYEAQQLGTRQRLAVKLLHPELSRDPASYARFRREAQIAVSLETEHVVPVSRFGKAHDGTPYLVMEFLEGEDLRSLLARDAPLSAHRAASLILQACRGLGVAHARGIVHRDLKPENLFVCRRDGRELLKLLDFGIAKLLVPQSGGATVQTQSVMGTPHYMSPEQAEGTKAIDQRTDIYALGTILYEALCSQRAHPGGSYNEIISHILLKAPVPLASLRADLSPILLAAVERAMEADVAKRYQSIVQLMRALERFLTSADAASGRRPVLRPVQVPRSSDASTLPELGGIETAARTARTPHAARVAAQRQRACRRHQRPLPRGRLRETIRSEYWIWGLAAALVATGGLLWGHQLGFSAFSDDAGRPSTQAPRGRQTTAAAVTLDSAVLEATSAIPVGSVASDSDGVAALASSWPSARTPVQPPEVATAAPLRVSRRTNSHVRATPSHDVVKRASESDLLDLAPPAPPRIEAELPKP